MTAASLRPLFALGVLGLALAGCGSEESKDPAAANQPAPNELRLVAGSELKDIEPMLPTIQKATGVSLKLEYTGTLDVVERLQGDEKADGVWVSHAKYLMLTPGVKEKVKAQEKTMLSPVVLGIKASKAAELKWTAGDVSWKDIAEAAGKGRFTFGMSNPAASNSGFTALVGLAAALSGKGEALTVADIPQDALSRFFSAQRLTAGSSGWLADAYINDQNRIDGLVNYESVLLSLNASGQAREKLTLIYPKEGLLTADYPLMLLNNDKRGLYDKVIAYVRGKEFQQAMTKSTLRRPISPDVSPDPAIPQTLLVDLPFPGNQTVVDTILDRFLNVQRVPAHSFFVLDTSGSMSDEDRIGSLRTALKNLSGADTSLSGRYARFLDREKVTLIAFSSEPQPPVEFVLAKDKDETLQKINAYADSLYPKGGTAIYDSVLRAYREAMRARDKDPKRNYSIVLMTDGNNSNGRDFGAFENAYRKLGEDARPIKVFAIGIGSANFSELDKLAKLTGGRSFDARKGLAKAFKEIRGYQ
ncbi:VWA domain-containing protein [Parachitinimonas caeni]|uniref:VWA domain-containing protein n=1 Tax=Parachitinimonas caeni TaxID=3031301 RepID=A0ABT7E383_9NEIS|nr:VWA domain-containing protein [Parachitinimonas caeni]MDK2126786.1 VWA domain-containing protein [Parachitinimonas caeni]